MEDSVPCQYLLATSLPPTLADGDLCHWLGRLRDYDAKVVFTLGTGAVEVFGHIRNVSPLSVWVVPIPVGGEFG